MNKFTENQLDMILTYDVWKQAWEQREAAYRNGEMEEWRYQRGRQPLLDDLQGAINELKRAGITQEEADAYLVTHP